MAKEYDVLDAFDIGMHYLELLGEGVSDEDVGECIRRFVEMFADFDIDKGSKGAFTVVTPKAENFIKDDN